MGARIVAANAKKISELENHFKAWKDNVILKDVIVGRWSGANSEVLFIESERICVFHEERYWVPCWTVWARTKDSQRYYTVVIRVDVDDRWRLKSEDRHSDVDVLHVIEKALSSGRDEVVRKMYVPHASA